MSNILHFPRLVLWLIKLLYSFELLNILQEVSLRDWGVKLDLDLIVFGFADCCFVGFVFRFCSRKIVGSLKSSYKSRLECLQLTHH